MDEAECLNFLQALNPKQYLDKYGFHLIFREHDADGDGSLDKEEMNDMMLRLVEGERIT